MRTTQQLRDLWGPACHIQVAKFTFHSGVTVTVDARIVPALSALDAVMHRWGYEPRSGETWGYACRAITGGTGYSLHAFGIAVDVNSRTNPYGSKLVTDMPRNMIDAIGAIRTVAGLPVWRWGGDYSGNKDAMHFEVVASPAELAAGIVHPTYPTPVPTPVPSVRLVYHSEADHMHTVDVDVTPDANGEGVTQTDIPFDKFAAISGYEDTDAFSAGKYGHYAQAEPHQTNGKLDVYVKDGAPGFPVPIRVLVFD